jgi:galactokinase
VGGLLFVDFADSGNPLVESVNIAPAGYAIFVVDSGADHAGLNDEYAAIPTELRWISSHFGKESLREVKKEEFVGMLPELRRLFGDRAVLRAFHIFAENERVRVAKQALLNRDMQGFFHCVRASGESSFMFLQNVCATGRVRNQELPVVLATISDFLGEQGAFRIQGGGFAGTVEAFVPESLASGFVAGMEKAFGTGCCRLVTVRKEGAVSFT